MKNRKGFTLVELLAVVTIMGILMVVAIGSVNRIIENTRRDTFASTAKEYINTVRTAVTADNMSCKSVNDADNFNTTASATPDGVYFFQIDTSNQNTKDLMESGGKSSFGNAEMKGYVVWTKATSNKVPYKYKILLWDTGIHGFKEELEEYQITRSQISTNLNEKITDLQSKYMDPNDSGYYSGQTVYECRLN